MAYINGQFNGEDEELVLAIHTIGETIAYAIYIAKQGAKIAKEGAVELRLHRKNVNITRITSSSFGLGVSFPLVVTGLALAPLTAGISLVLVGVGAGAGGLSGVTSGGAVITELVIANKKCKEVNELMSLLHSIILQLQDQITSIQGLLERLQNAQAFGPLPTGFLVSAARALMACFKLIPFIQDLLNFAKGIAAPIVTASARFLMGGIAGLGAAIDVANIADSAYNMRKRENISSRSEYLLNAECIFNAIATELHIYHAQMHGAPPTGSLIEAFECCICSHIMKRPVRCSGCSVIVGCATCIEQSLQRSRTCPKCRHPWNSIEDANIVKGLDEALARMRLIYDKPEHNE